MVNFRLSEEEYERLRSVCVSSGARSVSDFARKAVFRLAGLDEAPTEPLGTWAREIGGKVEELDREVKRLAQLVKPELPLDPLRPHRGVRRAS